MKRNFFLCIPFILASIIQLRGQENNLGPLIDKMNSLVIEIDSFPFTNVAEKNNFIDIKRNAIFQEFNAIKNYPSKKIAAPSGEEERRFYSAFNLMYDKTNKLKSFNSVFVSEFVKLQKSNCELTEAQVNNLNSLKVNTERSQLIQHWPRTKQNMLEAIDQLKKKCGLDSLPTNRTAAVVDTFVELKNNPVSGVPAQGAVEPVNKNTDNKTIPPTQPVSGVPGVMKGANSNPVVSAEEAHKDPIKPDAATDKKNEIKKNKPEEAKTEVPKKEVLPPPPKGNNNSFMNALGEEGFILTLSDGTKVKFDFVLVSPGNFKMGISSMEYRQFLERAGERGWNTNAQDEVAKDAKNQTVDISNMYLIGKYELTREQYEAVVKGTKLKGKDAKIPASGLSKQEIDNLLKKLRLLYPNLLIDLPTEREWEFAAKGNSAYWYPWGDDFEKASKFIHCDKKDGEPRPIDESNNALNQSWTKAVDMVGNVKELCKPEKGFYQGSSDEASYLYVARGGSYLEDQFSVRTTSRHPILEPKHKSIGLRLVIRKQ